VTPSDLDLPVPPSAEQIRKREFATVRRGYDIDQVKDYLYQIADQITELERDVRGRKASVNPSPGEVLAAHVAVEMAEPKRSGDPYAELGNRFATMIENADLDATAVVDEAKAEAARILDEARTEADRIRVDAQARAEEARQEASEALVRAREESDRIVGGLSVRREALVMQMQEMQSRLLGVAQDLEAAMDTRDEVIERAVADRTVEAGEPTEMSGAGSARSEQGSSGGGVDQMMDPRYEDLWVTRDEVEIPDLAPIDLDFDEDRRAD